MADFEEQIEMSFMCGFLFQWSRNCMYSHDALCLSCLHPEQHRKPLVVLSGSGAFIPSTDSRLRT